MRRTNQLHVCLAVVFLLAAVRPLAAQTPNDRAPNQQSPAEGPEAIVQQQPSFLVRAEVNHATRSYRQGDSLSLTVTSEVDAFVYVIYKQADGKLYQIFPNSIQPENRVKARQAVRIPSDDDLFRIVIGAPFGKEVVKVIASTEPVNPLADPEMAKAFFNPLSHEKLKGVEFALGDRDASGWAEDQIEIVTYPRGQSPANPAAKRFGVFFGLANYEFNAEAEEASGGKHPLNLATCHRDARQMADVLGELGRLNAVEVRTNELATRKNIEQAITGWLPSVSKPGDTVVIYFSGHGLKLDDDNGDEADGKDEFLVPFDFMAPDVLEVLLKRQKAGKLEPRLAARVKAALALIERAGSVEKGRRLLVRQTAISDDLFAHWLQRLAGRQIVVILDSCFSGGFATQEKGDLSPAKDAFFDFFDREVARLKDLGQREMALLSACGAQETAAVRLEKDLSVMTKYLLDSIVAAPRSLTLEQGFENCREAMHGYFSDVNKARAGAGRQPLPEHRPYLFNYCDPAKPPLLKP